MTSPIEQEPDFAVPTEPMIPSVQPTKKKGAGFLIVFGLLNFGLYLTVMMPALFSLPYKVQQLAPGNKAIVLGVVAAIGAVVTIISGPMAGVLSDRTRTRWGRRRPWLVGGILVLIVGSVMVALAPNVPALILGWMVVCVGGAGPAAAITPVVAEQVPESQRGTVGAIVGVATQLGGVLGYTIGGLLTFNIVLLFATPVIVLAALAIVYMVVVSDPLVPLPLTTIRQTFRLMIFNPRRHRDFSLVWLGKFLMQVALALLTTYQLYYLADRLGFSAEEAGQKLALVGGIGIVVTMAFAVVSGTLSDKLKRRRAFIFVASLVTAVGLVLMAFADGFTLFFAAVLCILGAAGMFGAVDVAMASDLVPEREQSGRWMTIYNLAASLPGAIAPLLGSGLLLIGSANGTNYTALFLAGAVIALGTGIVTSFIRGVR
ncbi:MFS transporter [Microbacterium sp. STN6]|uniref:MFS transporter n=1 Tax=Microbacterium sp. STN6 TaxID=2995588 RepID=UPI002260FEAE|nr:MFS transporter [Microbacterium sp. STN6]MCX7523146.1 MFS transporter [Microbacterium sp. STN6]